MMEKPEEILEKMREEASKDEKPLRGLSKHALINKFEKIQELREERNEEMEKASPDYDRVADLNRELEDIRKELAKNRIPYHPIIGCEGDYRRYRKEAESIQQVTLE